MVTVLLLVTILHGADGLFLQSSSTGNWTEAKLACSSTGGRLPLPGDNVTNSALAEHLQANDVNSAWIDVKSVVTPWHINGVVIYDQGCHGAGILGDRIYHNAERWDSCRPWCKGRGYHFAGYLRSGSSATCVCLDYITPLRRLRDNNCRGPNFDGYRVVFTSQPTSYPVANLRWTARSGSRGGMCALTVTVGSGSNPKFRLEEDYCYKPHNALCCVQNTTLKFQMYTWFDAHYKCSVLGGSIITQRDRCGQSHTDPADYSITRFWSGVHAWVWYINDTLTLDHRFTNWSQEQPSLESGSCVVVTQEGAWESAFCDEPRTVVCETVETTPTTPRSTSSQLTSLQTETISSKPTDSVSSGEVPTNQGQHSPGNTSGITDETTLTTSRSTSSQLTSMQTETISSQPTDSVSPGYVPTNRGQHAPGNKSGIAGIAAGAVVGALVVLALVGAVIWVLMRRKGKTDRGSPTHLDNPVYSNDDVIISRTEIGPHETTIRENSMYGCSGEKWGADSDACLSDSTATTVGGTGSDGQSKPREVSSVHMTIVDNELYGESDTAQASYNEPVYSLDQLCNGEGHDEPRHNNDDNDDDGDFESVNEAISSRELQPHSQLSRHDSVV